MFNISLRSSYVLMAAMTVGCGGGGSTVRRDAGGEVAAGGASGHDTSHALDEDGATGSGGTLATGGTSMDGGGATGGISGSSADGSSGKDASGADANLADHADVPLGTDTTDTGSSDQSSRQDAALDGATSLIKYFDSPGRMAKRGTKTELCWQVVGAETVIINPDVGHGQPIGDSEYCASVMVDKTTTYTLTVDGTITAQATIYAIDSLFQAVGDLRERLEGHTASLLPDGKVLIAGGYHQEIVPTYGEAEVFDPATRTFAIVGTLTHHRASHTATTLTDGRVLLAGGDDGWCGGYGTVTASAEIYYPATGKLTAVGKMTMGRSDHTASLLPDGRILITGGGVPTSASCDSPLGQTDSAEIFDPKTGAFAAANGKMSIKRWRHTATALADGTVLIAGGSLDSPEAPSADVFDPSSGTFRPVGAMVAPRKGHTATLLGGGLVLLTGGDDHGYGRTVELYNPKTRTFAATGSLVRSRQFHNATLLPSGKVMITGDNWYGLGTAELYDPDAGTFSGVSSMVSAAYGRTVTLLLDGSLLVTGGNSIIGTSRTQIASAELYVP